MLTGPSSGFDSLPGDKRYTFGGREFDRIDLRSKVAPGSSVIRQAVVATVVRDYAIKFLFKASSDVELEELVKTLESLSFLDSGPAPSSSPAPVGRSVSQPLVAANPSAPPVSPVASTPARNAQSVTAADSSTPALRPASGRTVTQPESASAPSALIKMASEPHTLHGDNLPSTEVAPPSQPLVKAPAKADPATKTAVMQAVMPAASATMSPAALNAGTSSTQPAISPQAPAAAVPPAAAPTQPVPAPTPAARKPAFTVQTEITRVQISGETLESYVIRKVPAVYPLLARQARIEGMVVLSIVVDEKGEVQDVKAISGPPLLARSAEDALRHWRFKPIIIDGKPTQVESRVGMNFQFPR
jgi:protein TonB